MLIVLTLIELGFIADGILKLILLFQRKRHFIAIFQRERERERERERDLAYIYESPAMSREISSPIKLFGISCEWFDRRFMKCKTCLVLKRKDFKVSLAIVVIGTLGVNIVYCQFFRCDKSDRFFLNIVVPISTSIRCYSLNYLIKIVTGFYQTYNADV